MPTLLDRYRAGEHREVWAEMVAGVDGAGQPIADADAEAVATETMRRVRQNIEIVIERLKDIGYRFGVPDEWPIEQRRTFPLIPPTINTVRNIAELLDEVGPVPLSLQAFWTEVGSVCLRGTYPLWENSYPDALWVESIEKKAYYGEDLQWRFDFNRWRELDDYVEKQDRSFYLDLAPDAYFKEAVSGGSPYGITLPDPAADAILKSEADFESEVHNVFFVDYLRITLLEWGGFPGFSPPGRQYVGDHRHWIPEEIEMLRAGLLPF